MTATHGYCHFNNSIIGRRIGAVRDRVQGLSDKATEACRDLDYFVWYGGIGRDVARYEELKQVADKALEAWVAAEDDLKAYRASIYR